MSYSSRSSSQDPNREMYNFMTGLEALVAFVFGFLPATLIGIGFVWYVRRHAPRAFRVPLWVGVIALGVLGCFLLWKFADLEASIVAYAVAWIKDLEKWKWTNPGQLVSVTLTVWLKTLVTFPIFAVLNALLMSGSTSAALRDQVDRRQRAVAQSSKRTARRMSGKKPVPGALDKQIVLGAPLRSRDDNESW